MKRCLLLLVLTVGASSLHAGGDDKYRPLIDNLEKWLPGEIVAKEIPGLSIALVDDRDIVWARGFGHEDPLAKTLATADTVYRVGSISKPISALFLMMLVEEGIIDLDLPIEKYLPEFRPVNKTGKTITLRQILAHRSGLVRESPVGNYFDATEPSLEKTVASLNQTELVYVPESTTSYSNAGFAVVGRILEKTQGTPFAKLMRERLLDPIGMVSSGYAPTDATRKHLAKATMWTYHGKTFPAPTWELGMPSAGNLYSSANDQAKLLSFLFAGGRTSSGKQLHKRESLESMFKIAYPKEGEGEKAGFGVSFFASEFEGKRRIGHGGAVYGFSTNLSALPDEKLGVVVLASKDVCNGVVDRIANEALRGMLAIRAGRKPLIFETTQPVGKETALAWEGTYRHQAKSFELNAIGARLHLTPSRGGVRQELRTSGDDFIVDDPSGFGPKLTRVGKSLKLGGELFDPVAATKPNPIPEKWRGLIGEYGEDHNILYILEKDGKLQALIEWVFLYPLEQAGDGEDVYKFPNFGLYHGDKIVFRRDKTGRAVEANAASVLFARRNLKGENSTYKLDGVGSVEQLRGDALKAPPPTEKNALAKAPDLVDLTQLDPSIKLDIRYASDDNFLGTPLYTSARAFLQRPAAEALVKAHQKLKAAGYGLLIHDAYRPWHVTKIFRDATPTKFHHFVADPNQGSRHNRGCAVDLTLYDLATGKPIPMVSGYDEFSDRAFPHYLGGTSLQRHNRDLLRRTMEAERFTVYEFEWWHFDFHAWRQYPILNETFEKLAK